MVHYGSFSDDFYINMNLNSEMELPSNRETLLYYFEQIQRKFPSMQNFYQRERGEFVLEENKEGGAYRWANVEPRRVCSGCVNPASVQDAIDQHLAILDLIPHALTVGTLDCESLNLMYGFDFTYRGNHNALIAEALGVIPGFEPIQQIPGMNLVSHEPAIQFSIDGDCRIQCRVGIETRTSAYQIRSNEFGEDQLSVYLTIRRYGSLDAGETFTSALMNLRTTSEEILNRYLLEHVLVPLQQIIAIK